MSNNECAAVGVMYSEDELQQMLRDMQAVSSRFYAGATLVGNHAFIEFCGLMNEYISICRATLEAGRDFTQCSTHTGVPLVMKEHHRNYLREKLDCIYGPSFDAAAELAKL